MQYLAVYDSQRLGIVEIVGVLVVMVVVLGVFCEERWRRVVRETIQSSGFSHAPSAPLIPDIQLLLGRSLEASSSNHQRDVIFY